MAKLETQINQIYLIHPDSKKNSLILHEEKIRDGLRLFLLLSLNDAKKKTEIAETKKISEAVLNCFRENQKIGVGTIFETTLAQINQKLADIAHKGSKSWLGKISAVVALKTDSEIYVANTGSASVWLKRKQDFSQVVGPEKKQDQPLKMFQNFVSGKIKENDLVVILSSNIFNFVSLELLTKFLSEKDPKEACVQVSEILKDSAGSEDAFAAFFLQLVLAQDYVAETPAVPIRTLTDIEPKPEPQESLVPKTITQPIYAPLPEAKPRQKFNFKFKLPELSFKKPNLALPKISDFKFSLTWLNKFKSANLSKKFFILSFIVFLLIFSINIFNVFSKNQSSQKQTELASQTDAVNHALAEAESFLIYKNDDQAIRLLSVAREEIRKLELLNEDRAAEALAKYTQLSDRINRVTYVSDPKQVLELRRAPVMLYKAGNGFFFAGKDEDSLSILANSNYSTILIINKLKGEINGAAHISSSGNWVVSADTIYHVNQNENEFRELANQRNGELLGLKFISPSRVYTANTNAGQIVRYTLSGGRPASPTNILKQAVDMGGLKDFGVDSDIYLLYPDRIKKFVGGNEQVFKLPKLVEPLTSAEKIFVGSNLYVLEPAKKRLLIISKNGALVNQIFFPNSNDLKDFYVDENARKINLINGSNLVEIVF